MTTRTAFPYAKQAGIFLLATALLVFTGINTDVLMDSPFSTTDTLQFTSFSTVDDQGNLWAIDSSQKRIVKAVPRGKGFERAWEIRGDDRNPGGLFSVSEIAPTGDGGALALNFVLDETGYAISREDILRFGPDGQPEEVLWSKTYSSDEKLSLTKTRLFGLTSEAAGVTFFLKLASEVEAWHIAPGAQAQKLFTFGFEDAQNMVTFGSWRSDTKTLVFNTRRGEVFSVRADQPPLALDLTPLPGDTAYWPAFVDQDAQGSVYFVDHNNGKLIRRTSEGKLDVVADGSALASVGADPTGLYFQSIHLNEFGVLSTENADSVLVKKLGGETLFYGNQLDLGLLVFAFRASVGLAFWLCLALATLLIVWSLYHWRKVISDIFYRGVILVGVVAMAAWLLIATVFGSFLDRHEQQVFYTLSQLVQRGAAEIDVSLVQALQTPKAFATPEYNRLKEESLEFFNNNKDPWNADYYMGLYTVVDDQLFTLQYATTDFGGSYHRQAIPYLGTNYERSWVEGLVATDRFTDAFGEWMYATAPVKDADGNTIAIMEIGQDLSKYTKANDDLMVAVFKSLMVLILVVILFIYEATLFESALRRRELPGIEKNTGGLMRPLAFLLFVANTLAVGIIPLNAEQFFQPLGDLPKGVVISLPLSAEMLFLVIGALVGASLLDRLHFRGIFTTGTVLMGLGLAGSALATDQTAFILARSLTGLGMGLCYIANKHFVILTNRPENRNAAFAQINAGYFAGFSFGVPLGSVIAANAGMASVYWVSLAVTVLVLAFALVLLVPEERKILEERPEDSDENLQRLPHLPVWKYLARRKVWSYGFLFFLPICAAAMFFRYVVPLQAEEIHLTGSDVGLLFLLYGVMVIVAGPKLSTVMEKYLGLKKSLLLGGFLMAASFLLFWFHVSVPVLFLVAFLIGLADAFGIPAQMSHFLNLPATKLYGETRAMGIYAVLENLGQVVGPPIFGLLLLLGPDVGLVLFGVGLAVLFVLYALISGGKDRDLRVEAS